MDIVVFGRRLSKMRKMAAIKVLALTASHVAPWIMASRGVQFFWMA